MIVESINTLKPFRKIEKAYSVIDRECEVSHISAFDVYESLYGFYKYFIFTDRHFKSLDEYILCIEVGIHRCMCCIQEFFFIHYALPIWWNFP